MDISQFNSPAQTDPLWLSSQAGGLQNAGAQGSPSQPGWVLRNSTPAKVATIHTAADASQAISFARAHNLAIAVKNTGHDWFGRSTVHGGGHLALWTHEMTKTQWMTDFVPDSCPSSAGPAVRLGAGVQFWQLFSESQQHQQFVVGGTCATVGHMGFTLMGGYGKYSRMYGSGATNLLEVEIVLADGQTVRASKCNEYADLFRAIRGGGGSFGLVTEAVYRTYPWPQPGYIGYVNGVLPGGLEGGLNSFVAWYYAVNQNGLGKHFGENLFIYADHVQVNLAYNGISLSDCQALVNGNVTGVSLPGASCSAVTGPLYPPPDAVSSPHGIPGWFEPFEAVQTAPYWTQTMSRYLRNEHLSPASRSALVAILASEARRAVPQNSHTFLALSLNYALGLGAPEVLAELPDTSVHPDVGEAVGVVKLTRELHPFAGGANIAVNSAYWENTQLFREELDGLLQGAGSYGNEGDYTEQAWQQRYWGSNYGGLLTMKQKYDPSGLFSCFQCVGAELAQPLCPADRRI